MSKNTQITDYFTASKKLNNDSGGRKRKMVTRELSADSKAINNNVWSSDNLTSDSDSSICTARKRSRVVTPKPLIIPKSRAQMMVDTASPKKGSTAIVTACIPGTSGTTSTVPRTLITQCEPSPVKRPVLTSPLKDNPVFTSPVKDIPRKSLFASPSRPVRRPISSSLKAEIAKLRSPPPSAAAESDPSSRAYKKYGPLVGECYLPKKFRAIVETLEDIDNMLKLIMDSRRTPTFDVLKGHMETKQRRTFTQDKLGRIKSVYDSSYIISYENTNSMKDGSNKMVSAMVVRPAMVDNNKLVPIRKLTSIDIARRKVELTDILIDIVRGHHIDFLAQQPDSPTLLDDGKGIVRWHKDFDLESIPDIEIKPYAIPPPPFKNEAGSLTAENFLRKFLKHTPSFQAEEKLNAQKAAESSPIPESSQSSTTAMVSSPAKIKGGRLNGVPVKLLEKIRAEQARKAALDMLRSPENERKISMIKSLPRYVRILLHFFNSEKGKPTLLDIVVKKIIDSYPHSISGPEVMEHLEYLAKLLPDWIIIFTLQADGVQTFKPRRYVRMYDLNRKITDIETRLDGYKKELEENTAEHACLRAI